MSMRKAIVFVLLCIVMFLVYDYSTYRQVFSFNNKGELILKEPDPLAERFFSFLTDIFGTDELLDNATIRLIQKLENDESAFIALPSALDRPDHTEESLIAHIKALPGTMQQQRSVVTKASEPTGTYNIIANLNHPSHIGEHFTGALSLYHNSSSMAMLSRHHMIQKVRDHEGTPILITEKLGHDEDTNHASSLPMDILLPEKRIEQTGKSKELLARRHYPLFTLDDSNKIVSQREVHCTPDKNIEKYVYANLDSDTDFRDTHLEPSSKVTTNQLRIGAICVTPPVSTQEKKNVDPFPCEEAVIFNRVTIKNIFGPISRIKREKTALDLSVFDPLPSGKPYIEYPIPEGMSYLDFTQDLKKSLQRLSDFRNNGVHSAEKEYIDHIINDEQNPAVKKLVAKLLLKDDRSFFQGVNDVDLYLIFLPHGTKKDTDQKQESSETFGQAAATELSHLRNFAMVSLDNLGVAHIAPHELGHLLGLSHHHEPNYSILETGRAEILYDVTTKKLIDLYSEFKEVGFIESIYAVFSSKARQEIFANTVKHFQRNEPFIGTLMAGRNEANTRLAALSSPYITCALSNDSEKKKENMLLKEEIGSKLSNQKKSAALSNALAGMISASQHSIKRENNGQGIIIGSRPEVQCTTCENQLKNTQNAYMKCKHDPDIFREGNRQCLDNPKACEDKLTQPGESLKCNPEGEVMDIPAPTRVQLFTHICPDYGSAPQDNEHLIRTYFFDQSKTKYYKTVKYQPLDTGVFASSGPLLLVGGADCVGEQGVNDLLSKQRAVTVLHNLMEEFSTFSIGAHICAVGRIGTDDASCGTGNPDHRIVKLYAYPH